MREARVAIEEVISGAPQEEQAQAEQGGGPARWGLDRSHDGLLPRGGSHRHRVHFREEPPEQTHRAIPGSCA